MKLIKTILSSGLASALGYVIYFFLTPYITDRLGAEAFGFFTLSKNFVGYMCVISVAFTAFMVRYISLAYHEGKIKEARSYYSSALAAGLGLCCFILLVALILVPNLNYIFRIPVDLDMDVKLLFICAFLNFCLITFMVPYTASCYITNSLTTLNLLKIGSYGLEVLVLLALFTLGDPHIWYVGIAMVAASGLVCSGAYIFTKKLTPDLNFEAGLVSLKRIFELLQKGLWESVNQLGVIMNSGLDLWVTNLMLPGIALGQLAIAKMMGLIFVTLASSVAGAFHPRLLKAFADTEKKGDKKSFIEELKFAMQVNGFFSGCAFAIFCAFGLTYYKLWLPRQNVELLYLLTMVTVLGNVWEGIMFPTYYVNTLTTKLKPPSLVTICNGLINVGAMFILLKYTDLGVFAVVWTTAIISFFNNFVFCAIYCPYTLGLSWKTLYPTIVSQMLVTLSMLVVSMGIAKILEPTNWIALMASGAVCFVANGIIMIIFDYYRGGRTWKVLQKKIKLYI